jgi:hypothetical protein
MGSNKRYPRYEGPDPTQRHCWVLATRTARGPWPGLILEWRKTNAGDWQARVVYVPDHRRPQSTEDWFAESQLRIVDTWPSDRIRGDARTAYGEQSR